MDGGCFGGSFGGVSGFHRSVPAVERPEITLLETGDVLVVLALEVRVVIEAVLVGQPTAEVFTISG